jgi:hypothetical protein
MVYEVLRSRRGCLGGVWERLGQAPFFVCSVWEDGLGREQVSVLFGFAVEDLDLV